VAFFTERSKVRVALTSPEFQMNGSLLTGILVRGRIVEAPKQHVADLRKPKLFDQGVLRMIFLSYDVYTLKG
jgi:hypothetical protein